MKLKRISALGAAFLAIAASQPAQAASVFLQRNFTYSKSISNEGSGALTPIGGMSATFAPIHWVGIYEVSIIWTYLETFDGVSGGGGITFDFGGYASVDNTIYDGAAGGNGKGGAPGDAIDIYAERHMEDDFRSGPILGLVGGSNPFTVSWDVNTDDAYSTHYGPISGTLRGYGYLNMMVDFLRVPEPSTWAMMLLGLGMIGFAARRKRDGVAVAA